MTNGTRRRFGRLGVAAAMVALGACEPGPDPVAPGVPVDPRNDPAHAADQVALAVADFECALGAYIVVGGLLGEELIDAAGTPDRVAYDRRDVLGKNSLHAVSGCESLGVYSPLSAARSTTDQLLVNLEVWTDGQLPAGVNRTALVARAAAYGGYSYVLLGEGFCSGVEDGSEMFPADYFRLAEQRFTRAISAATAVGGAPADSIRYMALVGRARVRLNLGLLREARADAALVPPGFVRSTTPAAEQSRRHNRVFVQNSAAQAVSVGPAYRDLTMRAVHAGIQYEIPDYRVRVVDSRRTSVDGTPIWEQMKYPGVDAPLPIATESEAYLIQREAELRLANPSVATSDAVMKSLIEGRRRVLFLEGHRLYDVRRFNLALQPATGSVYPKGGVYGDTRCLPMPDRRG